MLPADQNRIDVIDALRGVAVLGILWINLPGHAFPFFAIWDPYVAGGTDPWNIGFWSFSEVTVEGAMRGLFSLLFSASIILFLTAQSQAAAPMRRADLYMRRNLWLILFGLVHGFLLLMPGDILYTYGICALILFPFRLATPKQLAWLGVASTLVLAAVAGLDAAENAEIRAAAFSPEASEEALIAWEDLQRPGPQMLDALTDSALGGYLDTLAPYANEYANTIFSRDYVFYLLDAMAVMFFGMALMKAGALSGAFSLRRYFMWGAGLTISALLLRIWITAARFETDFIALNWPAEFAAEIARLSLSVGYALLFVGLWKAGALKWCAAALSATGRIALTNYIGGTLIATFLFYGYGLGLYDTFTRLQVMAIVIAVWAFQISFSLLWLSRFKIGPLEWGWRSLVQLAPVPILRRR